MNWQAVQEWLQSQVLPSSARIVVILVTAWLGYRLLCIASRRLEQMVEDEDYATISERERRARTLSQILRNVRDPGAVRPRTHSHYAGRNAPPARENDLPANFQKRKGKTRCATR